MTLMELYSFCTEELLFTGCGNFEALCLIEDILGYSKNNIYLDNVFVTDEQVDVIKNAVNRRKSGEPLQYILGKWDFYDLTFSVGEGVLIPRPETEELVLYTIKKAQEIFNVKEKLNYENYTGGTVFDAKDALQDGKMYDEENNFIDAYALDINAALLMGADDVKNVKIVGENKTGIMDHTIVFHNTRFETDLTGFVFNGAGSGIIDYAGSAPALTLNGKYAKTIIRKPSENMIVKGGHTVDLSNVENSSLLDNIAEFRETSEIYYKTQEDATRGFSFGYVDAIFVNGKYYGKGGDDVHENYTYVNATNQQWIDASNNNLWSEGQNRAHYPKDVHNEAKEWVFE